MKDNSAAKNRVGYAYRRQDEVPGVEASLEEFNTQQCGHCSTTVILNPDRTRERSWCARCDRYTCDSCALAVVMGVCTPLTMRMELVMKYPEMEIPFLDALGVKGELLIPQYILDKERVY